MKIVILLGKSGSGKGTQAALLATSFGLAHVSTGVLLRERCKEQDFLGRELNAVLARGGLVPTPLVFHLWLHELERLRQANAKGVVFEGSPRKLYEAWMLKETLEFYGWGADVKAVDLKISDKEALARLLARGRNDDEAQAIQRRLSWFKKEVAPVISFYKKEGVLLDVDGQQSVEEVQKELQAKLADFLK